MRALAPHTNAPGVPRLARRCLRTGGRVELHDARRSADFEEADGGRWVTFCAEHGTFCQHGTFNLARSWMAEPDAWYSDCADSLPGEG